MYDRTYACFTSYIPDSFLLIPRQHTKFDPKELRGLRMCGLAF